MALEALDEQLAQFRSAFDSGGLYGALRYLNSRTSLPLHRDLPARWPDDAQYLSVRPQGRKSDQLGEVPLEDSFCQFVLKDNGFNTANSAHDERLLDHPYRGIMNSYFGLPLSRKSGTIYGTFCHFDFEPMAIQDSEIPSA